MARNLHRSSPAAQRSSTWRETPRALQIQCRQQGSAKHSLTPCSLKSPALGSQKSGVRGQIVKSRSNTPRCPSRVQRYVRASAQPARAQAAPTRPSFMSRLINGWRTDNLIGDMYGGLTAAVVALPLALAFGVASGKLSIPSANTPAYFWLITCAV